jgi:hypothetical protein
MLTDLAVETFLLLRHKFFDAKGNPVSFPLRDKRNTQDDPLDEYISEILKRDLPSILRRSISEGNFNEFYCYRFDKDIPIDWKVSALIDPFPVPEREIKTQPRGKFRLDFRLTD